MPPKPRGKAKWTTVPSQVVARPRPDGVFEASFPVLDNGVKQLTITVNITADRELWVWVEGEPDAMLTGFQAWSNVQ